MVQNGRSNYCGLHPFLFLQIAPFDPTKKKKKKKVVIQDTIDDSVEKLAEKAEGLTGGSIEQAFFICAVLFYKYFC